MNKVVVDENVEPGLLELCEKNNVEIIQAQITNEE